MDEAAKKSDRRKIFFSGKFCIKKLDGKDAFPYNPKCAECMGL